MNSDKPTAVESSEELIKRVGALKRQLATAIQEDYDRVLGNICEGKRTDKVDGYLAELVLRTLNRTAGSKDWEYRSILECVEAGFRIEKWWLRFDSETEDLEQVISRLFHSLREHFSHALNSFVYDSDGGLPLYVLDKHGKLIPPSSTNADHLFVRNMLQQDGVKDDYYAPPPWSRSLFVKQSDIKAFWLIHGETETEESRHAKAAAVRAYIAGELPLHSTATPIATTPKRHIISDHHETKLLTVMQAARDTYYGVNFDPRDRDTWPKQIEVITWLMATYSLSKREAESIDVVLRPDVSRKR